MRIRISEVREDGMLGNEINIDINESKVDEFVEKIGRKLMGKKCVFILEDEAREDRYENILGDRREKRKRRRDK